MYVLPLAVHLKNNLVDDSEGVVDQQDFSVNPSSLVTYWVFELIGTWLGLVPMGNTIPLNGALLGVILLCN